MLLSIGLKGRVARCQSPPDLILGGMLRYLEWKPSARPGIALLTNFVYHKEIQRLNEEYS
jgi:hypothetical protein